MMTPFFMIQPAFWFGLNTPDASQIGDAIGGITAPFFSLLGSILVYAAFKGQVTANKLIQGQFEQEQFLRLIESMNNRVINSTIEAGRGRVEGYDIFQTVLMDLKAEQEKNLKKFAIGIMTSYPERISQYYYMEFLQAFSMEKIHTSELGARADELKWRLETEENNVTWLYDNYDINQEFNDVFNKTYIARERFLLNIARNNFYKADFDFRMNIYDQSYRPIFEKYETFLEGYSNSVFAILDYISKAREKKWHLEYLENTFTNQEKILLFQMMMTGTLTRIFGRYLLEFQVFQMTLRSKYLICKTTWREYQMEIDSITPLIYNEEE